MVSQLTSVVKNTDDIHFLSIDSAPAVLSVDVARNFQRQHSHVLREIDRLRSILPKSFNASNFGRVDIPDAKGEKRRAYLLTRDALSLLVMGFTGKAAIMWKLRYIEAFNAMEQALHENIQREARTGGAEAVKAACQQARTRPPSCSGGSALSRSAGYVRPCATTLWGLASTASPSCWTWTGARSPVCSRPHRHWAGWKKERPNVPPCPCRATCWP